MRYFFLFSLFTLFPGAKAQVSIYLVSESKAGFELLIDEFVQNTEPVKELYISGLDTSDHQITIVLYQNGEKKVVWRKFKMIEPGQHKFVVGPNYKGEEQMRYRGKIRDIPPGVIKMQLQRTLRRYIPKPEKPAIAAIDTSSATKNGDTTALASGGSSSEEVMSSDSISKSSPGIVEPAPAKPEPAALTFSEFLEKMESAEFEFVKMDLALEYTRDDSLKVVELKQILQVLNYDNSKLQFIEQVISRVKDRENLEQIEEELEFVLSREKFRKLYLKS